MNVSCNCKRHRMPRASNSLSVNQAGVEIERHTPGRCTSRQVDGTLRDMAANQPIAQLRNTLGRGAKV